MNKTKPTKTYPCENYEFRDHCSPGRLCTEPVLFTAEDIAVPCARLIKGTEALNLTAHVKVLADELHKQGGQLEVATEVTGDPAPTREGDPDAALRQVHAWRPGAVEINLWATVPAKPVSCGAAEEGTALRPAPWVVNCLWDREKSRRAGFIFLVWLVTAGKLGRSGDEDNFSLSGPELRKRFPLRSLGPIRHT